MDQNDEILMPMPSRRINSVFTVQNCKTGYKKGAKILIVDDEDYNRAALKIILRYHCSMDISQLCDEAENGQEALQAVENQVMNGDSKNGLYELILMDCNMPIMDGYEAAKSIRKFYRTKGLK